MEYMFANYDHMVVIYMDYHMNYYHMIMIYWGSDG